MFYLPATKNKYEANGVDNWYNKNRMLRTNIASGSQHVCERIFIHRIEHIKMQII